MKETDLEIEKYILKLYQKNKGEKCMLYYIHGYMSEPNSKKGTLFRKTLGAKAIKYRDGKPEELIIFECIDRINKEIKNDFEAILIGSSLGGLLAAKTALDNSNVKQLILLNPAIIPPYFDISKIKDMPQRILAGMQDSRLFEEKINSEISILAGDKDEVVPKDWILNFAKSQNVNVKFFDDDHSFTKNMKQLPEIITNILNKNVKR